MKDFALVKSESGDWEGLYINGGVLSDQMHNVYLPDFIPILKQGYNSFVIYRASTSWVEDDGCLPDKLINSLKKGLDVEWRL